MREDLRREFEAFVRDVEPSLRRALVSAYGFERGRDATAEALGWAWQHWDRTRGLDNKVAYLFRVGQSKSRGRLTPVIFERTDTPEHWFEPGLGPALASLTERQRICVVLIHGFDWSMREVAELLGIRVTSVQSHAERGIAHLKRTLEVLDHG
jgi:DNA-directed RNA polymerase specialized sigma24 family protein